MNSLFRALGYKVRFFFFVFIKGHFANFRDEETGIKEIIEMAQGVKAIVTTPRKPEFDSQNPHGMCDDKHIHTKHIFLF